MLNDMILLRLLKVLIDLYVEWYGKLIWHYESVDWNMNDEIAMIMEMNMKHAEKCDWQMHWTKWILKWSMIHEWCPRDNMKVQDTWEWYMNRKRRNVKEIVKYSIAYFVCIAHDLKELPTGYSSHCNRNTGR